MSKTVLVIGTGTIGEPLITLFSRLRKELGVDQVLFHKRTPLLSDRSKVQQLIANGAKLCVNTQADFTRFEEIGLTPSLDLEQALDQATVVIDCTPSGVGRDNKEKLYSKFAHNTAGFIAQGSESGFGKPYAYLINDDAITPQDQFIQVVSCNTHNISSLVKTFAFDGESNGLKRGSFVCIRRASDISQTSFIAAPTVSKFDDDTFGTHHAEDVNRLFKTLDIDVNVFSSAVKVPTQYMHVIQFDLELDSPLTKDQVLSRVADNKMMALTHKGDVGTAFSFARDHSPLLGRILNQSIIPTKSLTVVDNRVVGFAFTSQDGNSLLSSVVAAERFMYPDTYQDKIACLDSFVFNEI